MLSGLLALGLGACGGDRAPAVNSVPTALTPLAELTPIPPRSADVPLRTEVVGAILLHLNGVAEVQRGGAGGWRGLKIGDAIRQGDSVRTAEDGLAEFSIGDAQLRLSSRTLMTFSILGAKRVRAEVAGSVEATRAEGGTGELELASVHGDAVARLEHGRLAVVSQGKRTSVVVVEGRAKLTSRGTTLALKEGQLSISNGTGAPSRPVTAPQRISLKVRWPKEEVTNRAAFAVRGKVSATARVWVQGLPVEPAPSGDFATQVALKRGKQRVSVVAVDVLGRKAGESRQITLDADAPSIHGDVRYQ